MNSRIQKIKKHLSLNEVSASSSWSETERELRYDLAAAYRLAAYYKWDENIFNHISAKLEEGGRESFLINGFGMNFEDVTASSLVKVDMNGNIIDPGNSGFKVNPAGFVIHSAVHAARPEIRCVLHTHQQDVTAISCMKDGLIPWLTQTHHLLGEVTYHDFQGIALLDEEKISLAKDLGKESRVMLLRNHGSLVLGRSIAEAVVLHYLLVRCCETQLRVLASCGGDLSKVVKPAVQVHEFTKQQVSVFTQSSFGDESFKAMLQMLESHVKTPWKV